MPTYEYRCPEGHEFEKFVQKMSDAKSELTCPVCGAVAQRRMSAGGGLLFKGSGFYITDYGKDGKKDQRAASEKSSEKSSGGTSAESKSSESKSSDGSGSSTAPSTSAAPASSASTPSTAPAPKSDSKTDK